ncbi:caspase family protein [Accumulibacter sp.]|uniref:caspase family protein n=1 Tax=Accumulibacter sp. TaxID=2053492 RepID=UPI002604F0FB|nr:caspase family protein [Accumulibacter sp.]
MAIVVCCLGLAGCLPQRAQVTMLQAPEIAAAAAYKSVSVARFSGNYGDSLSLAVENAMINARVQGKPVYRSVNRAPDGRSLGGDNRSLAGAARSQGSDALLIGEVTLAGIQEQRRSTTQYVCDQSANPKKLISKCVSGRAVSVPCLARTASMQVQVRLIDARTGNTVFGQAIGKQANSEACGNDSPADGRVLLGQTQAAVVEEILRKIVPHELSMAIALMDPDEQIRSPVNKERFAGAIRFATGGRLDRACEMLREVYEQERESLALNYDLGVCEEAAGAFWRANEHYRTADRLATSPNALITAALARNEENLRKAGAMAKVRADLVKTERLEAGAAPQTITRANSPPAFSQPTQAPVNIAPDALFVGQRSALVIGNAKYRRSPLPNPANDARAMASELRKAGFQVIAVEDAGLHRMHAAIDEFGRAIKPGGAAVVFYAGHGMQVSGENYLIPVDADLKRESDVQSMTLNLATILRKLEDSKSRVNVVILDACRDNPFARSWRSSGRGGLASIDAPTGTVIAFATAPGKTAEDGVGPNGLFTTHLLRQIRIPNQKIEDVLKNTRKGVAADSRNEQIPWDSSSLTGDFYFKVSTNNVAAKMDAAAPAETPADSAVVAKRTLAVGNRPVASGTNSRPQEAASGAGSSGSLFDSLKGQFRTQD